MTALAVLVLNLDAKKIWAKKMVRWVGAQGQVNSAKMATN